MHTVSTSKLRSVRKPESTFKVGYYLLLRLFIIDTSKFGNGNVKARFLRETKHYTGKVKTSLVRQ